MIDGSLLVNPGECEVVVGILWTRLDSSLPTKFQPEDRDSMTGTERELEDAFTGYEEATIRLIDEDTDEKEARQLAKPDILVYATGEIVNLAKTRRRKGKRAPQQTRT